ncbi:MAG: ABC transporter permease [Planctomycetota bacterium]|nr:MAG: ABC transporter permease [Planctomycetota bacterium]
MILQTTTIARNTFIESVRQPIYFIVLLLAGALQVFTTWSTAYSMGYTDSSEVTKDNKLLFDIGLATILVAGMLLAAFVATAVLSREIESKTILTVVSKPISRIAVVLGKYIGVAGALTVAVIIMTSYLMLAVRHGVMSTAADEIDMPVVVFSTLAVALSVGVAGWCNFYYGWSFPQTASLLLLPTILVAFALTLFIDKHWEAQALATDLKPQVMLASMAVLLALLVLAAVATAISTRLGQVMTIVTCAGVLMVGLLSNYMIGRHAYQNTSVGVVEFAEPDRETRWQFNERGHIYFVRLSAPPRADIAPGTPVYYGSNPNGFMLANRSITADDGTVQGVIATDIDGRELSMELAADAPLASRPPRQGDHLFLTETEVHPVAATLHAIVPNFQQYWLVDAITRNSKIPTQHVLVLSGYAGVQIVMFLAIGVFLFQRRDVG